METGILYNAIVIHKFGYGFKIELGSFYNWKYGSILGFVHKRFLNNTEALAAITIGDVITTYYQKTAEAGHVFGDKLIAEVTDFTEYEKYIGTTQICIVQLSSNVYKRFCFDSTYDGSIHITKENYGNQKNRQKVRRYIKSLLANEEIECVVLGLNKNKKEFLLKLTDKQIALIA